MDIFTEQIQWFVKFHQNEQIYKSKIYWQVLDGKKWA